MHIAPKSLGQGLRGHRAKQQPLNLDDGERWEIGSHTQVIPSLWNEIGSPRPISASLEKKESRNSCYFIMHLISSVLFFSKGSGLHMVLWGVCHLGRLKTGSEQFLYR